MLIVYGLLDSHPASAACEAFIKQRQGWFTSALHLLEAYSVLTKVYGVQPTDAQQAIVRLASSPLHVIAVDGITATRAIGVANTQNLDLTDAVLLEICLGLGATSIATEDRRLAQVCIPLGISVETPFDETLRQQVSEWEFNHLPNKGLARALRRVYDWLNTQQATEVASLFWSHTGGGSHLP